METEADYVTFKVKPVTSNQSMELRMRLTDTVEDMLQTYVQAVRAPYVTRAVLGVRPLAPWMTLRQAGIRDGDIVHLYSRFIGA